MSRTYVGSIGDRLKELGVEASVLTRGDVKYLAIPLKELTLAEGGAWEDRPHRRTGKKRSRKP